MCNAIKAYNPLLFFSLLTKIDRLEILGHVRRAKTHQMSTCIRLNVAGPRSAVGSASDARAGGPAFETRSGNIISFLLPLIQERQLSVTGESMCMKYWLTAKEV